MLVWVGKRPLTQVTAFPAQHVEQFSAGQLPDSGQRWADWPSAYPPGGLLFHGDNKEVLAHLLANGFRGKVNLVYIDPPFDSGADYVRKVSLRGATGSAKVAGERYTLGEQIQYTDIWGNDNYLQFLYERALLLKELLSDSGILVVHLDETRLHQVKVMLDEVLGQEHFINEVIWKRQTAHSDVGQGARHLGRLHDTILIYSKGDEHTWNDLFTPYSEGYADAFYKHVEPETGRRYTLSDLTAPGGAEKGNPYYEFLGVTRFWRFKKERMLELHKQGRVVQAAPGSVPRQKRYLEEMRGVPLQDIWDDIKPIQSQASERLEYPTQKPEPLLVRILNLATNPGDIVLDCFIGSGTAAAAAQRLGRRWIGCDINRGAIQTTAKRLQAIVREQAEAGAQQSLLGGSERDDTGAEGPAHLSFSVWRVNDYDLQIQHNEAVSLACEHIGVERTRTDTFFDGTLGRRLVKIVPFDHPLSPVDLEELRRELESRPDEDREITLVCLGIETPAGAWVEDWNRLRKGKNAANRIHVIELRSDQKYGTFIRHEPARAKVRIARQNGRLRVAIDEFVSPSIVERLRQQAGVVQPKIDDWRAMVDCVMIDPSYDGRVFKVGLSDIPERKTDFVKGSYELDAPRGHSTVAVKIIDMLGEEVLVTSTV